MKNRLATVAFLVLVGVVALRPLVTETYDSATSSLIAALGSNGNPTPVRTLVFDVTILAAATMAFAVRSGSSRVRTGLGFGFVLILVAGVVSCVFAGNKRLAINATIDWLCHPIAAMALARLMTRAWQRRLLLAAIVGTATVQAVQCYEQSWASFDDTWRHYEKTKAEFWSRQGVGFDDYEVALFEARLKAREASGTLSHSNVAASYLVLAGFGALGVAAAAWRARRGDGVAGDEVTKPERRKVRTADPMSFPFVISVVVLGAVWLTGSRGAMVAAVCAGMMWIVCARMSAWIARHRRFAFTTAWIGVGAAALGVVGHGLYHRTLPGASLNFRWQYWTASASMIGEHFWTGVGRENFGRHYLKHKPITSPEEVSNPHDLFVQAGADWGVGGVVGLITLLLGASWAMTRGGSEASERRKVRTADPTGAGFGWWVVGIGAIVVGGRWVFLRSSDPDNASYLYYTGMMTAGPWLLGAAAIWRAWEPAADDRRVLMGLAIGLFAFVLHDTINFALFVPASAMTALAALALCVSTNRSPGVEAKRWAAPSPRVAVGLGLLAIGAAVFFGVMPVARASARLERARASSAAIEPLRVEAGVVEAAAAYQQATEADPLDPTPYAELASVYHWAAQKANPRPRAADGDATLRDEPVRDDWITAAQGAVAAAIERDPYSTGLRRLRRSLARDAAAMAGAPPESADAHARAVSAARDVLMLYPESPADWVSLGDTCSAAGEATGRRECRDEALAAYRRALALDDARPEWEKYHRMRAQDREEIERTIGRIERM